MTEGEARAELEARCDAGSWPELTPADIDRLVRASRRVDTDGLLHSDTGWTPTFDLNAAARAGWLVKAGRAAGAITFSSDGQMFNREQIHEHCLAMADRYGAGTAGSISLSPDRCASDVIGNVNCG